MPISVKSQFDFERPIKNSIILPINRDQYNYFIDEKGITWLKTSAKVFDENLYDKCWDRPEENTWGWFSSPCPIVEKENMQKRHRDYGVDVGKSIAFIFKYPPLGDDYKNPALNFYEYQEKKTNKFAGSYVLVKYIPVTKVTRAQLWNHIINGVNITIF